jgi:hypothetical protein
MNYEYPQSKNESLFKDVYTVALIGYEVSRSVPEGSRRRFGGASSFGYLTGKEICSFDEITKSLQPDE